MPFIYISLCMHLHTKGSVTSDSMNDDNEGPVEDDEVLELYQWTQDLSLEDLNN